MLLCTIGSKNLEQLSEHAMGFVWEKDTVKAERVQAIGNRIRHLEIEQFEIQPQDVLEATCSSVNVESISFLTFADAVDAGVGVRALRLAEKSNLSSLDLDMFNSGYVTEALQFAGNGTPRVFKMECQLIQRGGFHAFAKASPLLEDVDLFLELKYQEVQVGVEDTILDVLQAFSVCASLRRFVTDPED